MNIKWVGLITLIGFNLLGCGGNNKAQRTQPEIARSDLEALSSFNSFGAQQIDSRYPNRFSQIFGGQSGANVRGFIDERVKYFLLESEIVNIEPQPKQRKSSMSTMATSSLKVDNIIVAYNFGWALWLQGLLDKTFYTLTLSSGQKVVADHSRVGILVFGEKYSEALTQVVRQSFLIHEARHSDCSGGVTQTHISDLERDMEIHGEEKGLFNALDLKRFPTECGHSHKLCQKGSYRGTPSCDRQRWGSYSIQLVFLDAVLSGMPEDPTSESWQALQAHRIDINSRLEFDDNRWDAYDNMMSDPKDHPDMNSLGLRP